MPRALLFLLLILSAIGAQAQSAIPTLTGPVVDTADVLAPDTEADLAARLLANEDSAGVQLVVLTVPALQRETIEELAERVFNTWGLGDAERDDGVLLLIARDDRELRIEVGYGLEGQITDGQAGRIIRDVIVPRFRSGDFDGGVAEGVTAIIGLLDGTYVLPPEPPGVSMVSGPLQTQPPTIRVILGFVCLLIAKEAVKVLLSPARVRYLAFVLTGAFLAFLIPLSFGWGALVLYALLWLLADLWLSRSAWGQAKRAEVAAEREKQRRLYEKEVASGAYRRRHGRSSGRSSSRSSSSGSSYSGGGGSSGGGGASGSW